MKRRPLFRARRATNDPLRIELIGVTKGSDRSPILAATTVGYATGEAVLVEAETEQRPTVLGLIASGRMKPDAGDVLINGRHKPRELRRKVALIDAPDVSDPDPDVITVGVVAEELMYAGFPSNPISARKWMSEHGFGDLTMTPIGSVEPSRRVRLLTELASQREGVEGLVIVSPDRHGGRPQTWWAVAEEFARRDFAVLVIAGRASWQVLHEDRTDTVGLDDDARDAIIAAFGRPEVVVDDAPAEEEAILALGAVEFDTALSDAALSDVDGAIEDDDPSPESSAPAGSASIAPGSHASASDSSGVETRSPETAASNVSESSEPMSRLSAASMPRSDVDAAEESAPDPLSDEDTPDYVDEVPEALGALAFDNALAADDTSAAPATAAATTTDPHSPLAEDAPFPEPNDPPAARPNQADDDAEDAR
ncbi:hypothetical protein [Microbacterium gorillae]|uniref:hypothetical protein n=1 Tax=Microbacterium gorillae TaxID=1231063 RepID=UPI003D97A53A